MSEIEQPLDGRECVETYNECMESHRLRYRRVVAENPDLSIPEQAKLAGCTTATIGRVRRELSSPPDLSPDRSKNGSSPGDATPEEVESDEDVAVSLAHKTLRHLEETGEEITSIAELKKLMRRLYREDHPLPSTSTAPRKEPVPEPDHTAVDTFGVVRAVLRHAEEYPLPAAAVRIGKYNREFLLEDLPGAIDYLTHLQSCLSEIQRENPDNQS